MDPFAREDVRNVLTRFDIERAWRASESDASEEVILLETADFARIDPTEVTLRIMDVLPHKKVWVIEMNQAWTIEPL
jgi:hypothetical protein